MKFLTTIILAIMFNEQPRQVILLYNEAGKSVHDKQIAELDKQKDGMNEREIVIKSFSASENPGEFKKWKVDQSQAFTFILVGKDGGEKHRSNQIVSYKELFGKIDAMPMRKSEIKNQ